MDFKELVFPILAIGGLGILFGLVLGYASKKFAVPVDERVTKVRELLPGANCGGCGFAGCDAYAQAVVDGIAELNACGPGGAATCCRYCRCTWQDSGSQCGTAQSLC